jgi:hypothetical protein
MQIIQFLVGVSYAAVHSFISYSIPVQVPDVEVSIKGVASAASSAGVASLLKKYLFRAAREEGIAENVNGAYSPDEMAQLKSAHHSSNQAIQYRTEYQNVPCINTSGQTFAIWLNVLYLAPLTVLFVRFFIRSYIRRTSQKGGKRSEEGAGKDALKGAERKLHENGVINGNANGKTNGSMNGNMNGIMNGKANGKH